MPDTMSEYMLDRMPDRMSERMSDRIPAYMSDRMPKINVRLNARTDVR